MIKLAFLNVLFLLQKFLLNLSLLVFRLFRVKEKSGIIVGVEEIASTLYSLGSALKDAKTVNFYKHPYYDVSYDFYFGQYKLCRALIYFISPVILGYLIYRYKTFIYISGNGYLIRHVDGRAYEFKKLKQHGCNVVCFFTGSDIRSFKLLNAYGKERNMDVITTYQSISHKGIDSEKNENIRFMLAKAADKYASAIFNPSVDQMSYMKQASPHPTLYFVDEEKIHYFPEKFKLERKIVVHAPSSPVIKGTPIVRAAIKQLQEEGYDFEYVELIGVPNIEVMTNLAKAHIALNQFYALVPGVFGIEAMMSNTVLLTSANRNLESSLFPGANEAWIVTPYWQVYTQLKAVLDSPMKELQVQANKGTKWVETYCSFKYSASCINKVIDKFDD